MNIKKFFKPSELFFSTSFIVIISLKVKYLTPNILFNNCAQFFKLCALNTRVFFMWQKNIKEMMFLGNDIFNTQGNKVIVLIIAYGQHVLP